MKAKVSKYKVVTHTDYPVAIMASADFQIRIKEVMLDFQLLITMMSRIKIRKDAYHALIVLLELSTKLKNNGWKLNSRIQIVRCLYLFPA